MTRPIPLSTVAAVLALLAMPARAGTIQVSSGLGADLQAAIDAAAPGDTIQLSGGPYFGDFVIPAGRDGLTLKGKATIDSPDNFAPFTVDSNDVTFQALTFRHARSAVIAGPDLAAPPLAGFTLKQCTFLDVRGNSAVIVEADDALITGCVFESCVGGLFLTGDRITVTKCKVLNDNGALGINVEGDEATVLKCTLAVTEGDGISIIGDAALVSGNKLANVGGQGIDVDGSGATVTGNTVTGATLSGLIVVGDGAEVSKNRVSFCADVGVHVFGETIHVSGNRVEQMLAGGRGYLVESTSDALVEGNLAQNVADEGFDLDLSGGHVLQNKAIHCGVGDNVDSGFALTISGSQIENNVASRCSTAGFRIEGTANLIQGNIATSNRNNGFLIAGLTTVGTLMTGNTAKGNGGEGIQNGGVTTVLQDCTSTGNLLDIANETADGASLVDDGGNVFKTGGLTTEPLVDE